MDEGKAIKGGRAVKGGREEGRKGGREHGWREGVREGAGPGTKPCPAATAALQRPALLITVWLDAALPSLAGVGGGSGMGKGAYNILGWGGGVYCGEGGGGKEGLLR